MKKKIYVNDLSLADAMSLYGISKATYYRASKRGYFILGYHKKVSYDKIASFIFENIDSLNKEAIKIAKKFALGYRYDYHILNDLRQEILLRWLELSQLPSIKDFNYRYVIAKNACYSYLKNSKKGSANFSFRLNLNDLLDTALNKELWQFIFLSLDKKEIAIIEDLINGKVKTLPLKLRKKILASFGSLNKACYNAS